MSKGFRVLLQIFQVLFLLATLVFTTFTVLMVYMDFGGTDLEEQHGGTLVVGFGLLAIACSPALWSLSRSGGRAAAPAQPAGGFERVAPAVPQQQAPAPSGGVFEPMSADRMPAPPASSYGQPSAGGYGGPPPGSPSPAPTDSPWGSGR